MNRIRGPLLAISAASTIAAIVAYLVFDHRLYFVLLTFLCLLVTIVLYAYGGSEGDEIVEDLRRADDAPPRKTPMGPTPPGPC